MSDRIYLYCHALDRRRWDLFSEVFHEDATCHLSIMGGKWQDWLMQAKTLLDSSAGATHHQVGNILIRIDGNVGHAETYVTAYHRVRADAPPGGLLGGTGEEYDVIVGSRYIDRFERRAGKWLIAARRAASEWRHLQPACDGSLAAVSHEMRGSHGDSDPSLPIIAGWRR
jgi:hypothetical protein